MKHFIVLFFIVILATQSVLFAKEKNTDMPSVKFNGNNFVLFYSAKNKEIGSYTNEYFKHSEGYTNWTELIAVHHFKNAYSPIDQAKLLKESLSLMGCPSALEINEKDNSAIIDFIVINSKNIPLILEFNVFKYEKDPICGTISLQYARRYLLNNRPDIEKIKKSFAKSRIKYAKKVKKFEIPPLIEADVNEGIYIKEMQPDIIKEEKTNINTEVHIIDNNG